MRGAFDSFLPKPKQPAITSADEEGAGAPFTVRTHGAEESGRRRVMREWLIPGPIDYDLCAHTPMNFVSLSARNTFDLCSDPDYGSWPPVSG
jgi:hypothetical protein